MTTLIDRIENEMRCDDEDREHQSALLAACFDKADHAQRELLDEAFICLCGWSLSTMIERQKNATA